MDDTVRDVERCSFSVTIAMEGKQIRAQEKILRSNNNTVRGVETSFAVSASEADQCTPLKVDVKSMVRVFQRAIEQAYGVDDVTYFEFKTDATEAVPGYRIPVTNSLATITWGKSHESGAAGHVRLTKADINRTYDVELDHLNDDQGHKTQLRMESFLLTLFHDHGPMKGNLKYKTSRSDKYFKAIAIAAYETKPAKQRTKGIMGLIPGKASRERAYQAALQGKAGDNVKIAKKIAARQEAIDDALKDFTGRGSDKVHAMARLICDDKSCRGNDPWDQDAITHEKMNPDRCIVLKGHKCIDATTLRKYWGQGNFPLDPFTKTDMWEAH